ncbi:MAG: DUF6249 domain-containing protein [Bacteroidota bacterium]
MYSYFLIVAICLTVFGIAYTYYTYRNKERLALIESGLDLEFFKKAIRRQNNFLLAFGIIFIGFSMGILSGFFFEKYLLQNFNPKGYRNYPQAYLSLVPTFMGIGMLISFFIIRRLNREQQ